MALLNIISKRHDKINIVITNLKDHGWGEMDENSVSTVGFSERFELEISRNLYNLQKKKNHILKKIQILSETKIKWSQKFTKIKNEREKKGKKSGNLKKRNAKLNEPF